MTTFSIQSGSCGNCIYYESGGIKLLFDAGITYKVLHERLKSQGIDPLDINVLLISHDHSDHSKSIGIFQRKIQMPVIISKKTFQSVESRLGKLDYQKIYHFEPYDTINIKNLKIRTIRTPHDGIDPSIFIIDDGKTKVGIFTDLGYCFDELLNVMYELDVIYLESNYDLKSLRKNKLYPESLKRRIVGKGGHIENIESASIVKNYCDGKLKHLFLSHLSAENNNPDLALQTHMTIYGNYPGFDISIAPRDRVSQIISL
ncbi:MAG: MBL fold metallo-hydrolase [Spirochaetota bacterium]